MTCARHIHTDSLAPVFLTSSVTGDGLELVKLFFNLLPQRHKWADRVGCRHLSLSAADSYLLLPCFDAVKSFRMTGIDAPQFAG